MDLQLTLELHLKWLRNEKDGRRADLRDANLCNTYLRSADLRSADLRSADLRSANLWSTIGNKSQIKSLQIDTFDITYTKTHVQIGCQKHSIEEWMSFSDEQISKMENRALEWWKKWKGAIFKIIEMSPAE